MNHIEVKTIMRTHTIAFIYTKEDLLMGDLDTAAIVLYANKQQAEASAIVQDILKLTLRKRDDFIQKLPCNK